jgi:hypothetical protein
MPQLLILLLSSVQIFRLWQIYSENVNPLLKVTHTPSLQSSIIEAASNLTDISPVLEALMFSIYCAAVFSLEADSCQAILGSSKEDLSTRFRFGCQQALMNCGFLRSYDRDCLTALYLYLVSPFGGCVYALLISVGFGSRQYSPTVLVGHAWSCDSHCTEDGYT